MMRFLKYVAVFAATAACSETPKPEPIQISEFQPYPSAENFAAIKPGLSFDLVTQVLGESYTLKQVISGDRFLLCAYYEDGETGVVVIGITNDDVVFCTRRQDDKPLPGQVLCDL